MPRQATVRETRELVKMAPSAAFFLRGTRLVEFTRREVAISTLPDALEGIVIAHLSDIHFGRWVKEQHLRPIVEAVNRVRPDLVVLTGDYVGYSSDPALACARVLGDLRAPVFATLGNHDHWAGADQVGAAFSAAGITVLRNEWRAVALGDSRLYIVGLDDMHTRNHDAERAFAGLPEGPTLLLSHVPEGADLPHAQRAHLVLSGHTHGGQVHVPRLTPYVFQRMIGMRYLVGDYAIAGGPQLYVNRGIGSTTFPLRFGARPEVGVFTLRRSL
jgi:uncharacterized protein